ncbi:hypothetical protein [Nocardia sp. NRRL S-836]|uniref:hypothetical protein n=1 Tax=Nocardia sp. NRRL S-836 TaxID=1519492 RepID=UPI0006AE484E|nr:hypothetical protein [Nocardia sp. NRRL S-836]KOV86715.1 hypothetical protein ADL03_08385 [Nocardia sp. NRRL S-836]
MNALRAAIAELSARPDDAEVRVALAEARFRLALRTGPDEAVDLLRAAAAADPFQPKVFLHLGRLLHRQGRYFAALREYRRAAELVPDSRRVNRLVAVAEQELGQTRRWTAPTPDTWLLTLLDQLAGKTRKHDRVAACLRVAAEHATGAEYAVAAVLVLATTDHDVEPCGPAHPVLDAVRELLAADDPEAFVSTATGHLRTRTLPIELVCCLHFTRYQDLPALDALQLLDRYPDDVKALECFTELEIAVLDAGARKAWTEQRLDEAKLLWRETIPLDPHRVPVAVNLALLAAHTRSAEEYGPAWARLAELLYLHAAAAGDVQVALEERTTLHRAVSQNSSGQHVLGRERPDDAQLRARLQDTEALEVWLREWDCYYLNARLGFRSPTYRLGVCTTAARDALIRHLDSELRPRNWAGMGTFCDLAAASFAEAHGHPDEYLELEKARADALTDELFRRAMLLRRMLQLLTEDGRPLDLGLLIARHLFALPWREFGPLCAERGLVEPGLDLVRLFEDDLVHLAATETRLAALDRLAELLPHRLAPQVFRCRVLHREGRLDQAYAATLAALRLPVAEPDVRLRANLVAVLDDIGMDAIPEPLRDPRDRTGREALVEAARSALARFPRCDPLRGRLARWLTVLGGADRIAEAERLLAEGVATAVTDEQRQAFERGLARTGEAAEVDTARREVIALFTAARDQAAAAVDEYNQARHSGMARESLRKVRQAQDDVAQALTTAERAGLEREAARLERYLDLLGEIEGELQTREV